MHKCSKFGEWLSVKFWGLQLPLMPINNAFSLLYHLCSTFYNNDGGRGGVVTTGYLPLAFQGSNRFIGNQGRVLVVSKLALLLRDCYAHGWKPP